MAELVLTKNFGVPDFHKIEGYIRCGGYEGLKKTLEEFTPDQVIEEVKKSNLRGLGGAGFSTGMKWSFVPKDSPKPKYLVINADEGEPGTFKDRYLLEKAPHMLIEGAVIAAYAVGIHTAYVYIRGEYVKPAKILQNAIEEAYAHGFLGKNILGKGFDLDLIIHRGAGAYICGEETGLLESLEGKKGWPRLKPPFPAIVGLFKCPTVVNNVETLSQLPHIMKNGAAWFANICQGAPKCGGTRIFSVSGHVNRPGIYELPLTVTLREIIYDHAGGIPGGKKLKAVIPGGSSAPVLTADEIDVKMDFDSLMAAKTMGGSGGVIVMDEDTCMVKALYVLAKFYAHESCGQCTPCREGTGWIAKILHRLVHGEGRPGDPDTLKSVADNIAGNTICPFGDGAAWPVQSFVKKFRSEFEYHAKERKCDILKT
ncbi:MAG TPA: NADH-quinone oxidoreductase subunit NuoF [Candidatus Limnocylindrales bacterium]|nr:NADH-quinone oxidoreductase subunit NuoF [Candidatus Limnocylindrales bacterium]